MNNAEASTEQPATTPAETSRPLPASSKAKFRTRIAIVLLVIGAIACFSLIVPNLLTSSKSTYNSLDNPNIEQNITLTLDGYLRALANKDVDLARTYTSGRFQEFITEDSREGIKYYLYDGYDSVTVTDLSICITLKQSIEFLPKRTYAQFNAVIYYNNGFTGIFNGSLEEREGRWTVGTYSLNVPPEKERIFLEQHPDIRMTLVESSLQSKLTSTPITPTVVP